MQAENVKHFDREFHLKEYDTLRKEIMARVDEARKTAQFVIVVAGAIWAWLITNNASKTIPNIAYWLPFFVMLLGLIRSIAVLITISRITKYLRKLELILCEKSLLKGWETFVEAERTFLTDSAAIAFWVVSILVTGFMPIYLIK